MHACIFARMTHVPELLRSAMEQRQLSITALAKATGIDQSLIGRYLRGEVRVGVANAPRIAAALGLDAMQLLLAPAAPADTSTDAA